MIEHETLDQEIFIYQIKAMKVAPWIRHVTQHSVKDEGHIRFTSESSDFLPSWRNELIIAHTSVDEPQNKLHLCPESGLLFRET